MNGKLALVFLCSVAFSVARVVVKRQTPVGQAYSLPDGAELIVGQYSQTFDCNARNYGFYADVANGCRIFHVCHPIVLADGNQVTEHFSFFCGNQTVFDQSALVCVHPEDALPCEQSEQFYSANDYFGRTDRNFRE